jgi:hypothetical protein
MSFDGDLQVFGDLLGRRARTVCDRTVAGAKGSIVEGSALTSSPGQPVGATGDLRASWFEQWPGPWVAEILTHDPGARTIEKGSRLGRRLHRRGTQGGFHSVKLTRIHIRRIIARVNTEVGGDG